MKKILVLGASGQLGHRLFLDLRQKYQVTGTVRGFPAMLKNFGLGPEDLITGVDASQWDQVTQVCKEQKPDFLINCIGVIKQRKEVADEEFMAINAELPHSLARLADELGFHLIHFSTDCVFTGAKGNYLETDASDAEDVYGVSKLKGEVTDHPRALTLRTSIVGRELAHRLSLFEWFLSQPKGSKIKGFTRCNFSGFPTHTISSIIGKIVEMDKPLTGLYHMSSEPITKYDLLMQWNRLLERGLEIEPLDEPVIDRSLISSKLRGALELQVPPWEQLNRDLLIDFEKYE